MKKAGILAGLALVASLTPAFAQEVEGGNAVINAEVDIENVSNSASSSFRVITIPGQNTNGEDLKCAVVTGRYDAGKAVDCNWAAPK